MDQVVSQTTYPKLVAVGENPMKLNSVLLCVEGQGKMLPRIQWILFFTLYASYYVFLLCIHMSLKIFLY